MSIEANQAAGVLVDLGIIDPDRLEHLYPRTRDRDDVSVWRCSSSGVIVLSRSDHVHARFYQDKEHPELHELGDRDRVVAKHDSDTSRRAETLGHVVTNRDWLDVGTGAGGILDALAGHARKSAAVEPQGEFRTALDAGGYEVFERLSDAAADSFDVVTAFHVLEHLTSPLEELREARRVLREGGRLVVEVPHARDALIGLYGSEAFSAHTFWSEHLVLHTRESLRRLLQAAGFTNVIVEGLQRYPLANHLHWLSQGRPGGHQRWDFLTDPFLDETYAAALNRIDATDTLLATAWAK